MDGQFNDVRELISQIIFKDESTPRFTNIHSPYFIALQKSLASYAINTSIDPIVRARLAIGAGFAYSSILPQSGLPIDDPHIHGILNWYNYVIDRFDELGINDPVFYLECCLYVSGIYERRAEKTFPDMPLDSNNPYIQKALAYMEKGLQAINNNDVNYATGSQYHAQLSAMHEHYLPKTAVLEDKHVQNAIHSFEACIQYATQPPTKKITTYITPSTAMKELEMAQAKWTACVSGNSEDQEKAQKLADEYKQDVSVSGFQMWDRSERWASMRDADYAKAALARLYLHTPQTNGKTPDYEKAAQWFSACEDKGYNQVYEALELPELQVYLSKIKNSM